MATINKDFKIKQGLIVEGSTATVNGLDILTKKQADQDYIVGLIGGTATSANEANKVVKRDASGNFAAGTITAALTGNVTGNVTGNLTGNVTGTVSSIANHNTAGLAEHTSNKYFTDARALTATAAAYDVAGASAAAQTAAISTASADATTKVAAEAALRVSGDAATLSSAKTYTDTSVAALVSSAPAALDTLNELALALGNDASFSTSVATTIGTKVSKTGDTMTGLLVLSADPAANLGAATKQYVDTARTNAVATAAADATSKANAALTSANIYADALTTTDIAEGTEKYFTDARAKTSAADLLVGAVKTNITITGNGAGLVITAENGVADSTTSDLVEGTNKYFTNARAVDALQAVVPKFTAVEINSVAKEVAAKAIIAVAGTATALSWAKADYKTAKAVVKFATATNTSVSEILLTLDSSDNVAITEYAEVSTSGVMGTVTATVVGGDVRINVTTLNNATTVIVKATLLA